MECIYVTGFCNLSIITRICIRYYSVFEKEDTIQENA